ncbi:alpha-amylase family glycosyl hydrolase [Gramella sp. MAR_2010_147]|uniref:alpha-amylase family glycosyl hydrolase n=1 Tax=Gramella sp. MAR_2010_147 TaxID=1250205 RepID=UPI000A4BF3E5|nr:alpha-amylase family glycosyl hydrolase [Gramella sp. MAR_2010_147]
MGSTETRFGSRTELQSMISTAHSNNISVIADIVLNHNSGGASENNRTPVHLLIPIMILLQVYFTGLLQIFILMIP